MSENGANGWYLLPALNCIKKNIFCRTNVTLDVEPLYGN